MLGNMVLKLLPLACLLVLVPVDKCTAENYSSKADKLVVDRDIQLEVEDIKSMEQVKKTLRQLITHMDECGTGSCHNYAGLGVCDYLALVDLRLNGELGLGMTYSDRAAAFSVTKKDVALLKRMVNSCKMTSYQYWNFPLLTHVQYAPSREDNDWINKELQVDGNRR